VPQSDTIASSAGGVTGFDSSAGDRPFTFTGAFALREHRGTVTAPVDSFQGGRSTRASPVERATSRWQI
jgi:hypothetical protein